LDINFITKSYCVEAKDGEIAALTAKIGDTASVGALIAAREATRSPVPA